jgi:hypothetical protein
MTVKQLIERLQKEDPDRLVVMAADGEGNSHSPLSGFWTGAYRADSKWSGEVGLDKLTEKDKKQGYTDEDVMTDGVPALILSPSN